ncbi:MAG: aldo/keto reductase [Candidatus Thermoplasmatota archaeon]|nr:aldo/keto reductase [Candidatus Thermoplasmatota archaeon]
MNYRLLGKTGIRVSELCLGTMTFGNEADRTTSFRIMDRFSDDGGNFVDTADIYNKGKSEEILGEWLKTRNREDFIIATKVRFRSGNGPNGIGLTRKHILHSIEKSLERLGTDYVDLLQVHAWDPLTPLEETMSALNSLVQNGKVRYIGASNFRGWQLALSLGISRSRGYAEFVSIQPQYSLLCRSTEFELIPLSMHENISVLPWSPLKGGLLSGKYSRDAGNMPEDSRIGRMLNRGGSQVFGINEEYTWKVINSLKDVAGAINRTPSQVALNWLLNREGVTSPIIGARNIAQLEDNLASTGWTLNKSDMDYLDSASKFFVTYPYDEESDNQQKDGRIP